MAPAKLAILVLVSVVALIDGWSALASAQTCSDTAPCPKGFQCEVTAVSGCATPAILPLPPCDDAGPCAAANPAPPAKPVECTPQEYRSCVPGPCMADGDCASGMVCHTQTTSDCTAPAAGPCMPGSNCGAFAPPPPCTPTVERMCVPRYLLPCADATDCGAGFTCEPQNQCGCSAGSAGAGALPPAAPPAPEPAKDNGGQADPALPAPSDAGVPAERPSQPLPPGCGCTPTVEKYCKPIEVECTTDGQCPSMWKCTTIASSGSGPACMTAPPGGDAGTCTPPPAPVEIRRCTPPYDGINVGVSRGGDTPAMSPSVGAPGHAPQPGVVSPPPGGGPTPTAGANPPSTQDESGSAPAHAEACSATYPGANERDRGLAFWVGLLSLAAAWIATRRRR